MVPWQKPNFQSYPNVQKDDLEETTRICDFFFQQNMIMLIKFGNREFSNLMKNFGTNKKVMVCCKPYTSQ